MSTYEIVNPFTMKPLAEVSFTSKEDTLKASVAGNGFCRNHATGKTNAINGRMTNQLAHDWYIGIYHLESFRRHSSFVTELRQKFSREIILRAGLK